MNKTKNLVNTIDNEQNAPVTAAKEATMNNTESTATAANINTAKDAAFVSLVFSQSSRFTPLQQAIAKRNITFDGDTLREKQMRGRCGRLGLVLGKGERNEWTVTLASAPERQPIVTGSKRKVSNWLQSTVEALSA